MANDDQWRSLSPLGTFLRMKASYPDEELKGGIQAGVSTQIEDGDNVLLTQLIDYPIEAEVRTWKIRANKATATPLAATAVFFLCLLLAHTIETDGGNVDVDRLSIVMDEGALLSAKLWRPVAASASNPAPAVILIPGGNANLEYMSSMSLELARRGYVALAIDPYTIGRSDVIQPTPDLGSSCALAYIKELDFVDTNAIGMAGVGRMNAAAIRDGIPNGVKALFGFGAGSPGDPELAMNRGYFIDSLSN